MKKLVLACALIAAFGLPHSPAWASLGEGVQAYERKDYAAALTALRPEADRGDPVAQFYLGVMYVMGLDVEKDTRQAVSWYRKAAEQGNADAQNNLGFMYANGLGVRHNLTTAKEWFGKACDNGEQVGCDNYRALN